MHIDLKRRVQQVRDQRGVSIVEAMIGVAIVAVTALAMFQMSIISNRLSKNTQGTNDFNALVNEIRGMLHTEQSCRLAIGGPNAIIGQPGDGDIANRTQTWVNGMGIYLYRPISAGSVFLADATAITPGPPPLANRMWNEWEILELKLEQISGTMIGPAAANLRAVRLKVTGRRQSENQDFFRASSDIRLTIEIRGGRIVSCQSLVYGSDSGRAPICGSDEALVSQGGRLVCRQIQCWPPNPNVVGLNADGSVQCGP